MGAASRTTSQLIGVASPYWAKSTRARSMSAPQSISGSASPSWRGSASIAIRNPLGGAPSAVSPLATLVKRTFDRGAVAARRVRRPGCDDLGGRPASAPPAPAGGRPPACSRGWMSLRSPMSSVTAIAVSRPAQRQRLRLAQLGPRALVRARGLRRPSSSKFGSCTNRNGSFGSPHAARQPRIISREQRSVLGRLRDVALALVPDDARRSAGPRRARPSRSTAPSGCWDRRRRAACGRVFQSATAGLSLRSIL